jgi:hypothetical protein
MDNVCFPPSNPNSPYTVINNLAGTILEEEKRKAFIADVQAELVKIAHKLPWSF